jgi:putative transposase
MTLGQTDFSYFKIICWYWYYLSTMMDDYSRFIIAWKLFFSMSATAVQEILDTALEKTGIDQVRSDSNRYFSQTMVPVTFQRISGIIKQGKVNHIQSALYTPQNQRKIERCHRSIRNVINLQHYYFPSELEHVIGEFVEYNPQRYHESLDNLTPSEVYYVRGKRIIIQREILKEETLQMRHSLLPMTTPFRLI